jgi:hypothetical protein
MEKLAASGDETAQKIVRWTTTVLERRARRGNVVEIDANGLIATHRQHESARNRAVLTEGLEALTGNFVGSTLFRLTGDLNLARMVNGFASVAGNAIRGRNQTRQMGRPDSEPMTPPGFPTGKEPKQARRTEESGDYAEDQNSNQPSNDQTNHFAGESEPGASVPVGHPDQVTSTESVDAADDSHFSGEQDVLEAETPDTYESSAVEGSSDAGDNGESSSEHDVCERETPDAYEFSTPEGFNARHI